jgi:hypothetical protein
MSIDSPGASFLGRQFSLGSPAKIVDKNLHLPKPVSGL